MSIRFLHLLTLGLLALTGPRAEAEVALTIGYLKVEVAQQPTLSNLDPVPENAGLAGAMTGLDDNQTTGRFLGHTYALKDVVVPLEADPLAAARALLAQTSFVILDAPAQVALAMADDPAAQDAILINVGAPDVDLRSGSCRANLLHTIPSLAMRTDALAQFLVKRRWGDLAMITGAYPQDLAFADAIRGSLQKFGLRLNNEKTWGFDADIRRAASQEVPLFTQEFGDYDALIVADELGDFGRYIPYNTWVARPVVGSEGLIPQGWAPVIEQWGAAQLQGRFAEAHGRKMTSRDYAAWAAVRTLGEALTRQNSDDPAVLRAYILSPDFELAGFKGRPLTYRTWNGQLRQTIALSHASALVASAPIEGFLHKTNELDSLGLDQPESECEAFE